MRERKLTEAGNFSLHYRIRTLPSPRDGRESLTRCAVSIMSCVKLVLEIHRRSRQEPRARLTRLKNWNWTFVGRAGAVGDNAFPYAWAAMLCFCVSDCAGEERRRRRRRRSGWTGEGEDKE